MANGGSYESRNAAFGDGQHGGDTLGVGTHAASSIQQNVPPQFGPGSVLQLPNVIKTANGMSPGTYSKAQPLMSWMQSTTTGAAGGGNGTMNV